MSEEDLSQDIQVTLKLDQIKLKDYLSRLNSISQYIPSKEHPVQPDRNIDRLSSEYDLRLSQVKSTHQAEIKHYQDKIRNLESASTDKQTKQQAVLLAELEEKTVLIEEMTDILDVCYQKHNRFIKHDPVSDNFELKLCHFVNFAINKLFADNQHLLKVVSTLEARNREFETDNQLPYVKEAINRNEKLVTLASNIDRIAEKSNETNLVLENVRRFLSSGFPDC